MSYRCVLPGRKVGLGLRQLLAPGLPLLHGLLLGGGSARDTPPHGIPEHALILKGLRRHAFGGGERVPRREERRIDGPRGGDEAISEAVDGRVLELDSGSGGRHDDADDGLFGNGWLVKVPEGVD